MHSGADQNIATALNTAGHTTTVRVTPEGASGAAGVAAFAGDLSEFDAIYWSIIHWDAPATTMPILDAYVSAGGGLYVTGYDSVAHNPGADEAFLALLGATGGNEQFGTVAALSMQANPLTVGVRDIRGVVPSGGYSDRDQLLNLLPGTLAVSATTSGAEWAIRSQGTGWVAYVSNGDSSGTHPSWENTSAGGAGAYNASLLNFAYHMGRSKNVLLVGDNETAAELQVIADVIVGDGHTVTIVADNYNNTTDTTPALEGDLSAYDAVVWFAEGSGAGGVHVSSTTDALSAYVTGGGRVFVSGRDAVANPLDPNLIALLGCTGSVDLPGATGALVGGTSLTFPIDIGGIVPAEGFSDDDALIGCGASVTVVSATATAPGQAQWLVRTIAGGEIAFISDSAREGSNNLWATEGVTPNGVYNAALRNFLRQGWDFDGDGARDVDCAPLDSARFPSSDSDICDGIDNDCNLATPDGSAEATLDDACDGPDSDLCTEGVIVCEAGALACDDASDDTLDVCDGADNDCNPATVDGADEPTFGDACDGPDSDLCTEGAIACTAGALACDDATGDTLDLCDGADNDCNPATVDGADEPTLEASCDGPDSDLCTEGAIVCEAGSLACTDVTGDTLDLCDGADNDCNPATIDGADEPTLATACDGPDSDLCTEGAVVCAAGSLACTDVTGDTPDLCDGADNDCNPATADGADEPTLADVCDGPDSDLCTEGAIVCEAGSLACDDASDDTLDLCDGADNDCNPATADGADEATLADACDGPDSDLCTEGAIVCEAGSLACDDASDDTLDLCDGADNDCNPATADGADEATLADACDGPDSDLCTEGAIVCEAGSLACDDASDDTLELCDGADNDCNPATADGADEATLADACDGPDSDLCTEGAIVCEAGSLACDDASDDTLDLCDGADNDCNPATADGADEATLADACDGPDSDLCTEGAIVCEAGSLACDDASDDTLELCGGGDEDCDGLTDDEDSDIGTIDPTVSGAGVWYADTDNDFCGDPASVLYVCADGAPEGYVANPDDADDSDGICCGNGRVTGTEACDDGNAEAADGCDVCAIEPGWACGEVDETAPSVCADTCGNGTLDANEDCDDGNLDAADGCTDVCGVEEGWVCNTDEGASVCVESCGDGLTLGDERCDDGNTDAGDGCSETCMPESGFACVVTDAISVCEETCGDTALDAGEMCDDGNLDVGDGCTDICDVEEGWLCDATGCVAVCGDGVTLGAETCDDGALEIGDGCDDTCTVEEGWTCDGAPSLCTLLAFCGDSALDDGEACDDGNDADDDGCDATCSVEAGWLCDDAEPTVCVADTDEDGVPDAEDVCPDVADPEQVDTDEDGEGDACDEDDDNDGVDDVDDACPLVAGDGADGCEDTGSDVGTDTGADVGTDTGADVGVDTGADVGIDTGADTDLDIVISGGAGCDGCATSGRGNTAWAMLVLLGLVIRRRRTGALR